MLGSQNSGSPTRSKILVKELGLQSVVPLIGNSPYSVRIFTEHNLRANLTCSQSALFVQRYLTLL